MLKFNFLNFLPKSQHLYINALSQISMYFFFFFVFEPRSLSVKFQSSMQPIFTDKQLAKSW